MMTRLQLNRRRFLKAVGASALTYPFLRSLPSYASPTSDPQYLILIFTPCGVVRYAWGANGPAGPLPSNAGTTTAAIASPLTTFRATLAPLASGTTDLTNQTIVLDGLNVGTANGSHEAGMAALWTGCYNSGPSTGATSVSIDQQIATQLAAATTYPSVQLMVRSSADFSDREVKTRMIYGNAGGTVGFLDPIDSPVVARSTLFPSMPSTSSSSGPNKTTFIRKQIFAQTNSELNALQNRMCTEDRVQLQNYQAMWNDLDTQLAAAATASQGCQAPEAIPAGYTSPSIDFPLSATLQMDILAFALACDLTRVASLQFSTATSQVTHSWIGSNQTDIHHNYSHGGPSSLYSLVPYGCSGNLYDTTQYQPAFSQYPTTYPEYMTQLPAIDLWYANQVTYLAQKLASLTTASGKNLLGQSVICWGSELDMGSAHNHDDTPFVLIGGGGGKLKTGQLVQFPLNLANGVANNPPTSNRYHNDLLITLAQVMGVSLSTFGSTSGVPPGGSKAMVNFCTGPIKEILTAT